LGRATDLSTSHFAPSASIARGTRCSVRQFWPWCCVPPALHERCKAFEVGVVGNQGDASFPAGRREERVVQQRRIIVDGGPALTACHRREQPATLTERVSGWCEDALASDERSKHGSIEFARLNGRACTGREFLHDDGAQKRERERAFEESEEGGFSGGIAKRVDEDVRVQGVLHARRRDSNTSSILPARRIAAMP